MRCHTLFEQCALPDEFHSVVNMPERPVKTPLGRRNWKLSTSERYS
jgi:hypothetical protein